MPWTRQRLQVKARAWIWCKAGEATGTGISGMYLASTQDVICARARGRRNKIPPVQPGLADSRGSEWWPSTWPSLSGQGVLDLSGKAGFGQENCKQSWIFKQV